MTAVMLPLLLLAVSPVAAPLVDRPASTVIALQRGGCERRCAVYKVVLFGDGTGLFNAAYYTPWKGAAPFRVAPERIAALAADAQAGGFFGMRDEYRVFRDAEGLHGSPGCTVSGQDDAPLAIVTVSVAGQARTIVHDHRCGGADPDRLTMLEDEIDAVAGSHRFLHDRITPK